MTTIRDPQTDVSIADYTIDGNWGYSNKISYTSSLSFTANTDIISKEYVDSQVISPPIDEDNIYYIGKHGSDSSNGRNVGQAFLTIQKGIDEANLQTPTSSSEYSIKINDSGSYESFNLTSKPYIKIEGNGSNLQTTATSIIGDNNSVRFDKGSGNGTFIEKQGSGISYLKCNEISGNSIETAVSVRDGSLHGNIKNINIPTFNKAFYIEGLFNNYFNCQNITGKITIRGNGFANITVKNQTGNIEVETFGHLKLFVTGRFDGNIIIGEGAIVDILIFYRVSNYTDNISTDASVNIRYIGHHIYTHRNLLIGADYAINPRQESLEGAILDITESRYIADNTICQTSGSMNSFDGENNNLKINTEDYSYIGILIPVENRDSLDVIGDKASISLKAVWTSGSIHNLRMALLSWTGTSDEIEIDLVDVWGPNPILSTGWIYENDPQDLTFYEVGRYETFKIENIPVDTSNTKNIAIFIWTPSNSTPPTSFLEISNVRCNEGIFAEGFAQRHFVQEFRLCQRYYAKSYDLETFPGFPTYISSMSALKGGSANHHEVQLTGMNINYPTYMLKTPKLTPYAPLPGEIDKVQESHFFTIPAYGNFLGKANGIISVNTGFLFANFRYAWVIDARF